MRCRRCAVCRSSFVLLYIASTIVVVGAGLCLTYLPCLFGALDGLVYVTISLPFIVFAGGPTRTEQSTTHDLT